MRGHSYKTQFYTLPSVGAEQQFQVAQHRTTIRPETQFGKDALPQESFDLSPAAKKDSFYVA